MVKESTKANHYQWRVVKTSEDDLERILNELDDDWEIFCVTPTIRFGSKFMGAPVPSEVQYTVVARQPS
jgi:hypothetical protein